MHAILECNCSYQFSARTFYSGDPETICGYPWCKMNDEKLKAILANIKLEDAGSKRFGQLSGGQQRVSLVIAMIHEPRWYYSMNLHPVLIRSHVGNFGNAWKHYGKRSWYPAYYSFYGRSRSRMRSHCY